MYSVTDAFKNAIKEPVIEYGIIGQIGNTQFTEENVIAGSMTVSNQCTDTNDIVLGSAYVGQLTATFTGIQLNRYDWLDKVVSFAIRVQLPNNQHEDVPMGYYTIKEVYHTAEGVQIKAYDNMHKFDKLFDATHFDFIGQPYAFLSVICSDCGITLGMTQAEVEDLPNGEHTMYLCGARKDTTDYASDIETYRDALFYLAQACACFATIDRQGRLVLRRYRQGKVDTITELHRLAGAEFSDYVTSYNGLYVTSLWDGRTTYYGYDIEELQESRVEAIERQGEEQDAVDDIEAEIAELVRKHNAHEITDEEYAQQRAQLDAELQAAESTLKMTTKYIKWLDKAIADAQVHGQGTFMDLGGNPFLQHKDSDLSPIADVTTATVLRNAILKRLSKIEYVPFSCSTVFGVHYDLGDRIMFSGGHADDDLGCIMAYDWTYNGQYNMAGFGGNPTETSSVVRPKADKEANRANINALNKPNITISADEPYGGKPEDLWLQTGTEGGGKAPIYPVSFECLSNYQYQPHNGHTWSIPSDMATVTNMEWDNQAGAYSILISGQAYVKVFSDDGQAYVSNIGMPVFKVEGITTQGKYKMAFDARYSSESQMPPFHVPNFSLLTNSKYEENVPMSSEIYFDGGDVLTHYEQIFNIVTDDIFSSPIYIWFKYHYWSVISQFQPGEKAAFSATIQNLRIEKILNEDTGETDGGYIEETGTPVLKSVHYNDNNEWKKIDYISKVDESEAAGGTENNGLNVSTENNKLSLKPNVMRAAFRPDTPQTTRKFSQFVARYTGEPDTNITITPYANHTFANESVKKDDDNAYKIVCKGVGGSGSYCVYAISGLTVGTDYYFNFAVNFGDGATFGNNHSKGLGVVFNTTGTISTDSWSGEPDTFDANTLYYSARRTTTRNYADFSFKATATIMYMCVVTADVTNASSIKLTLAEFVISKTERKYMRRLFLYDTKDNVWLEYKPFGGTVSGGGSGESGGSVVTITPTLASGTKIADYSINGDTGELYAPQGGSYTLPIASATELGGIKVGQNLSIDANGVLSATGGGGGTSDLDAIELTYAEYQALTPAEKADPNKIYFVTDYPSGGGGSGSLTVREHYGYDARFSNIDILYSGIWNLCTMSMNIVAGERIIIQEMNIRARLNFNSTFVDSEFNTPMPAIVKSVTPNGATTVDVEYWVYNDKNVDYHGWIAEPRCILIGE